MTQLNHLNLNKNVRVYYEHKYYTIGILGQLFAQVLSAS